MTAPPAPRVTSVKLAGLILSDSRPIDDEAVARLADSMATLGTIAPIMVRLQGEAIHVVAGQHHTEAARRLGWETIAAIFVKGSDLKTELQTNDENLVRHDLSAMEKSQQLARKVEIVEALAEIETTGGPNPPTSLKDGRKAGKQHRPGAAKATADATGLTKREVNKAVRRTKRIAPATQERLAKSKARAVALDALTDLDHDEQAEAVDRMETNGETARKAVETVAPAKAKRSAFAEAKAKRTKATDTPAGIRVRTRKAKAVETPTLKALKSDYLHASSGDREAFMSWIVENGL